MCVVTYAIKMWIVILFARFLESLPYESRIIWGDFFSEYFPILGLHLVTF